MKVAGGRCMNQNVLLGILIPFAGTTLDGIFYEKGDE